MLTKKSNDLINILIIVYFTIALFEAVAELVLFTPLMLFSRIAIPVVLIMLYKVSSEKPSFWFYLVLTLFLFTNVLFFFKYSPFLLSGKMICILQRILMLLLIFKLTSEKRYGYILLASVPFLLIFFYLNSITNGIAEVGFNSVIIQSIIISFIGGISLAAYLKIDNRQNSWLLISTLLFIGLQFVAFIERYYSSIISLSVFSPIGVVLNTFGFFTFYKFVIAAEKHDKYYV
jgi:hypothetical protein